MDEQEKLAYIKTVDLILIDKHSKQINRFQHGIVTKDCSLMFANYLLHAFKDIESYSTKQEDNLVQLLNKINYGK